MTAHVGHILALMLFVSAVLIMAARLLGAFAATPPAGVVRPARRWAALGLLGMAATGSMLFSAEATHVASNPRIPHQGDVDRVWDLERAAGGGSVAANAG
jgi:heme A synthase